MIRYTDLICI